MNDSIVKNIEITKDFGIGIYRIMNKITGRVYIGCTKAGFYKRVSCHLMYLRKGRHECSRLQKDWNLFGENNFIVEVVEYLNDPKNIFEIERYWQNEFKGFLYNNKAYKI